MPRQLIVRRVGEYTDAACEVKEQSVKSNVALSQRLMIAQLREDGYAHTRTHTTCNEFFIGVFRCFASAKRRKTAKKKNTIADLSGNEKLHRK